MEEITSHFSHGEGRNCVITRRACFSASHLYKLPELSHDDNSALFGPPIDGQDGSDKKMFMFANNRTSPNCCPGTFSTSTGCVCTTENQRDFIASRGNQGPTNLEDM